MFGNDEYTKLLLHANGDLSPSHHNLTYNGGVKLDYVSTPVGSGAYYFDGTNDYLSVPDSDDWNFGSGDFTIDCWIYNQNADGHAHLLQQYQDLNNRTGLVYNATAEELQLYSVSNGSAVVFVKANWSPSTNIWYHIAVSRQGNTFRIFVDGVDITTSGGASANALPNLSGDFYIGRYSTDQHFYFNGHIADLQITKGEAKYTSNFTEPTTRAQSDANTVLLLSGSGDYGTTGHSITTYNGIKESSDSYKFGSGAFYFDGTNDYLSVPDSDDWHFGNEAFTVDLWVNPSDLSSYRYIIGNYTGGQDSNNGWMLIYHVGEGALKFYWTTNGSDYSGRSMSFPVTLNTGVWSHLALVRNGSEITLFLNGISLGTSSSIGTESIYNSTRDLFIGKNDYNWTGVGYAYFNGYIDELRVSKGIARWTSDFTPQNYEYGSDTSVNQDFQFEIIDTELEFDFDLYSFYNNEFLIYTKGYEVESGNIDIYARGFLPHSGDFNLYSDGFDSFNIFTKGFDSMSIYAWGSVLDSGEFPYYSFGFDAMPIFAQGTKEGSSFYGETTETLNIVTSGTDGTILTNEFNIVASSSPPIEIYDSMPLFTPREIFTLNDDLNIFCNTHKAYPISSEFSIYTNAATSSGVFGQPFDSMNVFLYGYYSRTPRAIVNSNPSTPETQEQIDNSGSGDASFGLFAIGL